MDNKEDLIKSKFMDPGDEVKVAGLKPSVSNLSVSAPNLSTMQIAKPRVLAQSFSPTKLWRELKADKTILAVLIFVLLQTFLLLQTQNAGFYQFLGNLDILGSGIPADKETSYKEALFLKPKSYIADGIARMEFARGDFEKAKKYANISLQLERTAEGYKVLTLAYLAENNLKEAEKNLETTLQEFPEPHPAIAQAELNWVQKQLRKNPDSRELYEKALSDKAYPQLAMDFHHMGYFSRQGADGFPKNPYLALAFEDIAVDLHVEKIDPLRLLYAHINRASAFNEIYEPQKSLAESGKVIGQLKDSIDKASVYYNMVDSDRLLGDYTALLRDSSAGAELSPGDETWWHFAEANFFSKKYAGAKYYAVKDRSHVGEDMPWSTLYKELSMKALHQNVDLSDSRALFQGYLESEIVVLRKHNLNKRANDLQLLLNMLTQPN